MPTCARCGAQSELRVFWVERHRRERICQPCFDEAKENRGLTQEQIAEDNARWNRIFTEKFVDPTYYTPAIPTLQSSFGAFASEMEVAYRG